MVLSALLLAASLLLCAQSALAAVKVNIEARFKPEAGFIADAAMMGSGRVGLAYPDSGHVAEYSLDGRLFKHLVREAGVELPFRPSCCVAGPGDDLLIYDEAEQAVFEVEPDGNFSKGLTLAYDPGDNKTIALSKVGDLAWQPELRGGKPLPPAKGFLTWAMQPDNGDFCAFDGKGRQVSTMNLSRLLPFENAMYTRAQFSGDKSLFVLDYAQGAILYQRGAGTQFRRIRVIQPPKLSGDAERSIEGAPMLQDFAVDGDGNIIAATRDDKRALMLLSPGAKGYDSRRIDLKLPAGANRIGIRYSRGKFIVWLRDDPEVLVLRLQQ